VSDQLAITEKQFTRQIKELADFFGFLFYHPFLSIHSARGFPDVVLCKPPRLILAELKTDDIKKSQPSMEQYEWLEALQRCPGVEAYLWRPADLEGEVVGILRTPQLQEDVLSQGA
jgi:hypothetical protein